MLPSWWMNTSGMGEAYILTKSWNGDDCDDECVDDCDGDGVDDNAPYLTRKSVTK